MLTLRPALESDLPYLLAPRRQTMDKHLASSGLPAQLDLLKTNPARRLYERLGFRIVADTGAEFHMERPAGGSAGQ